MATMLMTRRDPFAEFDAVIRRAFPARAGVVSGPAGTGFTPPADVLRDGDDAVVRLELPGLDLDKDVTVELDRGRLVVRGERRDEREDRSDGRYLREMRYGSFRRSFALPEHVTAEALSASYDAGVLSVRVSGAYAGTEPRKIVVTAGAPVAETATDDLTVDAETDIEGSQN